MSEEGAGPEQGQNNMRLLQAWYRAVGLSEDDISALMREPAIDERAALNQGKPIRPR